MANRIADGVKTEWWGRETFSSMCSGDIHQLITLARKMVSDTGGMEELRKMTGVIAFPSFNPAQLYSAKSIIQPSNTTLIHGIPPKAESQWRTKAICQLNSLNDDAKIQNLKISTLEYSECLKALLSLYDEWSAFNNLVLSPTGSKMQTVAVGIFRSFIEDIQIIYPTPLRFTDPTDHTHGAKQIYQVDLDFFIGLHKSLAPN